MQLAAMLCRHFISREPSSRCPEYRTRSQACSVHPYLRPTLPLFPHTCELRAGWPIHFSLRHNSFLLSSLRPRPRPAACITFQPRLSPPAEAAQSERGGLSGVNGCRVGRAERMTCLGRKPNILPSSRLQGSVRM